MRSTLRTLLPFSTIYYISDTAAPPRRRAGLSPAGPPPRSSSLFSSPSSHVMRRILVPNYLEFAYKTPRAWPRQRQPTAAHLSPSHSFCVPFLLSDRSTRNRAWCAVTRRSGPALFYPSHRLRLPRTTAKRLVTADCSTLSPTVPRPTSFRLGRSRSFGIAASSQELRTHKLGVASNATLVTRSSVLCFE